MGFPKAENKVSQEKVLGDRGIDRGCPPRRGADLAALLHVDISCCFLSYYKKYALHHETIGEEIRTPCHLRLKYIVCLLPGLADRRGPGCSPRVIGQQSQHPLGPGQSLHSSSQPMCLEK